MEGLGRAGPGLQGMCSRETGGNRVCWRSWDVGCVRLEGGRGFRIGREEEGGIIWIRITPDRLSMSLTGLQFTELSSQL